jgi:hypothetical protein
MKLAQQTAKFEVVLFPVGAQHCCAAIEQDRSTAKLSFFATIETA